MSGRWNQFSPFARFLAYAVAAILLFVTAAGIGAAAALLVTGNVSFPTGEKARPDASGLKGEQDKAEHADAESSQHHSGAETGQAAPRDRKPAYTDEVNEIQAGSVDAFLDSHEMLLHYDALTSDDIENMQDDQAALKAFADRADALSAPRKYEEQKRVFRAAIEELHQACRLAYALAADPVSATQADFDNYDRLVNEAAANLERSNGILGKDYKKIEGVRGVSTPQ